MARLGERSGVLVNCEYCGKEVYKTLSQYNKREHHFCSNKCQSAKKKEETFENRPCEFCGNQMYISKKSKQRFCSIECQNQWQKTRTGDLNPRYTQKEVVCDNCGRRHFVSEYRLTTSAHHFCSKECRQEWYRNVWSQQDDWKLESRKRAAKLLKGNAVTKTKPQLFVNNVLDSIGAEYSNEEVFDFYSIDNFLTDLNLAIEVMGDFWHCNRLVYSTVRYDVQSNSIRRDKAKNTFMRLYYDMPILYIWECDTKKRPDVVKALIISYINSNGKLDNYHSVNYDINESGELYMHGDIVVMYQDMDAEEIKTNTQIAG